MSDDDRMKLVRAHDELRAAHDELQRAMALIKEVLVRAKVDG